MDDDARWASTERRDPAADGRFVFGVVTTGIYCRPSCPARRPLRRNVRFFDTPNAAEAAGLRACLRCDPAGAGPRAEHTAVVTRACRILDERDPAPPLHELARLVGVSSSHLHRLFRAETGITPKAYATARRAERTRRRLESGSSVTDAIYEAGFASTGPFYVESRWRLGMTPSAYSAGGGGEVVRVAVADSDLGAVVVAATERGVCAIELGDDPDALVRAVTARFHGAELVDDDPDLAALVGAVVALVEDPAAGSALPLDVRGTAFQERVWRALRSIRPGETVTYAELADRIGSPGAARAVGAACAANPVAVAVPCHRVVRTDGALAGYRWGTARKSALLDREAAARRSTPGLGHP
ncbi:MAG TPA: bifunctional DNA-binding transcriptional regulator/O6-methylguanine-DNA methyltransferase Ada [Acidimicrobiales bacterium]